MNRKNKNKAQGETNDLKKPTPVIVIRQDEHDVLVVARIPEGMDGQEAFNLWASDVRDVLCKSELEEAYWEELAVVDLD